MKSKAYLYATRTLLCCIWIERHRTQPPVQITELVSDLLAEPDEAGVRDSIESLIQEKRAGAEKATTERRPSLADFLCRQAERLGQVLPSPGLPPPTENFDEVFRAIVRQVSKSKKKQGM